MRSCILSQPAIEGLLPPDRSGILYRNLSRPITFTTSANVESAARSELGRFKLTKLPLRPAVPFLRRPSRRSGTRRIRARAGSSASRQQSCQEFLPDLSARVSADGPSAYANRIGSRHVSGRVRSCWVVASPRQPTRQEPISIVPEKLIHHSHSLSFHYPASQVERIRQIACYREGGKRH